MDCTSEMSSVRALPSCLLIHTRTLAFPPSVRLQLTIIGFPDPFAVATINGEQTKTTTVSKKTLNPYWNESFDLYDHILLSTTAICPR